MNKKQSLKFLTDLGISKKIAEKMVAHIPADAEETPTEEVDEAYDSAVAHQNELYTNGEVYREAIKTASNRKLAEAMKTAETKIIKISGLTAEEVKDKKFEQIVDLAFKKASASVDKNVEEVQAELQKVSDELKRVQEEEIPKIRSEVDKEKNTFREETALTKHLSTLKLRAGVESEDAIILIRQKANRLGYKMNITEKGEIEFMDKEDKKILSSDKRTILGSKDIISEFLTGQIEKSNADAGTGTKGKDGIVVRTEGKEGEKEEKNGNYGSTIQENIAKTREYLAQKKAEATPKE